MRRQITDRTRMEYYNDCFMTDLDRDMATLNPDLYED